LPVLHGKTFVGVLRLCAAGYKRTSPPSDIIFISLFARGQAILALRFQTFYNLYPHLTRIPLRCMVRFCGRTACCCGHFPCVPSRLGPHCHRSNLRPAFVWFTSEQVNGFPGFTILPHAVILRGAVRARFGIRLPLTLTFALCLPAPPPPAYALLACTSSPCVLYRALRFLVCCRRGWFGRAVNVVVCWDGCLARCCCVPLRCRWRCSAALILRHPVFLLLRSILPRVTIPLPLLVFSGRASLFFQQADGNGS
jgi:hypothetical protein